MKYEMIIWYIKEIQNIVCKKLTLNGGVGRDDHL